MRRRFEEPRHPEPAGPFLLGGLAIDYERRRVTLSGSPVESTPTEFDLLAKLSMEAGRVVARERLLRRVWSPGRSGNLGVLRIHLVRLRASWGRTAAAPGTYSPSHGWAAGGGGAVPFSRRLLASLESVALLHAGLNSTTWEYLSFSCLSGTGNVEIQLLNIL